MSITLTTKTPEIIFTRAKQHPNLFQCGERTFTIEELQALGFNPPRIWSGDGIFHEDGVLTLEKPCAIRGKKAKITIEELVL